MINFVKIICNWLYRCVNLYVPAPMASFKFEEQKAVAALLYICESYGGTCDKYAIMKILYLAERLHLSKYGRPITGDDFITMKYGPVPTCTYDIIKSGASQGKIFDHKYNNLIPVQKSDLDELSGSDIECLNEVIAENTMHHFEIMKKKTHDAAFEKTKAELGMGYSIPFLEIAKAGGASTEMLSYIEMQSQNLNCELNAPSNW